MARLTDDQRDARRRALYPHQARTETTPEITATNSACTGPNDWCVTAHRAGRSVHVITEWSAETETLVMPSNHFVTAQEGFDQITAAYATAPTIRTDDELRAARAAKTPHKLPVGWVDPQMRNDRDKAAYSARLRTLGRS